MKVPLRWLKEYVSISVPLNELCERLTMAGLEVSQVDLIGDHWANVTIGKITKIEPHPNADRLKLVTVDLGEHFECVVCGAPNVVLGAKVPFASIGARLVDPKTGDITELKRVNIRGVVSEGMICSEKELGISDNHEGIMILPDDAPVGMPLFDYMGDAVLDVEVTPNRPDCLSVIGIAREIAALTGNELHIVEASYPEPDSAEGIDSFVSVEIAEPELCPRYCASLVRGVKVAPSPKWLQQRLLACGMRPINNVVDITNYVMLEYGQPLHAFDYNELKGKRIVVRRAFPEEVITTLDGVTRVLHPGILVIADAERAVAVAGIMGGAETEVKNVTSNVLIESANFNPRIIHHGKNSLRLSSEASTRFEKGISPHLPLQALKRATQMVVELAGGTVARGLIDVSPGMQKQEKIKFHFGDIRRLLGIEFSKEQVTSTLKALGFSCEPSTKEGYLDVTPPRWRTDISCAADLVEEVARIAGYDKIPATTLSASLPKYEPNPMLVLKKDIQDIMVGCGFQEVLTYSLVNLDAIKKLSHGGSPLGPTPMRVANPMSREWEYLRTSLRPGLLTTLARNRRFREGDIRLFEIGRVFFPRDADLPEEKEMFCAVISGSRHRSFWRGEPEEVDFFVAKGVAETLLARLGIEVGFERGNDESLLEGRCAWIMAARKKIGVVGEVHPKVVEAFELSTVTYLIELELDKLLSLASGRKMQFRPLPRYPSATRDIALVVDARVTYQEIVSIIRQFPLVSSVSLFDVYVGEQIPKGKKSLAFRLIYQSPSHTLTDREVDQVQQAILARLSQELGATLRT